MRPDHPVQLAARTASVWMKIFAAIVGFVAAYLWYRSATSAGTSAAEWNKWAAITTGTSVFLQGLSAGIDAWIPATASWS